MMDSANELVYEWAQHRHDPLARPTLLLHPATERHHVTLASGRVETDHVVLYLHSVQDLIAIFQPVCNCIIFQDETCPRILRIENWKRLIRRHKIRLQAAIMTAHLCEQSWTEIVQKFGLKFVQRFIPLPHLSDGMHRSYEIFVLLCYLSIHSECKFRIYQRFSLQSFVGMQTQHTWHVSAGNQRRPYQMIVDSCVACKIVEKSMRQISQSMMQHDFASMANLRDESMPSIVSLFPDKTIQVAQFRISQRRERTEFKRQMENYLYALRSKMDPEQVHVRGANPFFLLKRAHSI